MCQEKHLYLINANLKCKQRGIELVTDNDLHINLKIITLYIKTKTSYIESIIYKPVTPSILCNFYNMDTSVKRTLVSVSLMSVLKTLDYNASSVFMMFCCYCYQWDMKTWLWATPASLIWGIPKRPDLSLMFIAKQS